MTVFIGRQGENNEKAMITENMSLVDIEFAIRQCLKECDYWGELPISRKH